MHQFKASVPADYIGTSSRGLNSNNNSGSSQAAQNGANDWRIIDETIEGIATGTMAQYSFQRLHSAVVRLISHELGGMLHRNLQTKLREKAVTQLQELLAAPEETFLSTFQRVWGKYSQTVRRTSDFLYHFNRVYCEAHQRPAVREVGLRIFGEEAFVAEPLQAQKLKSAFLRAVLSERETGATTEEGACLGVVAKGLLDIDTRNLFEPIIETPYLQELDRFYSAFARDLTSRTRPAEFVTEYLKRLEDERERGKRCLVNPGSTPKIESRMQEVWLIRHLPYLLQVGPIQELLAASQDAELLTMFQTIASVGEAEAFLKIVRRYLVAKGSEEAQVDVTQYSALRRRLLQLSKLFTTERLERLLDAFVQGTLTEAIGMRGDDFPAALVKYLDDSIRTLEEAQLESACEEVVILFRYVPAKDLFDAGCKTALARRLLGGATLGKGPYNSDGSAGLSSLEREMMFLRALKKDCGSGMVKKMEGMLSDMRESFEVTSQFLASQTGQTEAREVDVSLSVLASGYWPLFPTVTLTLPRPLLRVEEALKKFYAGRHGGRRLSFCMSQGSIEVRVAVGGRRYEVTCPLLTGVCLLQFTDDAPRGVAQVARDTGASPSDVLRSLAGLCKSTASAQGLLQCADKPIHSQSMFSFHTTMKAKVLRWRVTAAAMPNTASPTNGAMSRAVTDEEGGEETQPLLDANGLQQVASSAPAASQSSQSSQLSIAAAAASVEDSRRHKIDAAIIRVMKSRRSLDHQALIAETCRLLSNSFVPTPEHVKKRIDSLLEREFIERSKEHHNIYQYIS